MKGGGVKQARKVDPEMFAINLLTLRLKKMNVSDPQNWQRDLMQV